MLVLIGIGLAAGFITAISPCVLPVLPIVFAGGATGGRRKPFAIIAGLILSFTAFTLFGVWLLRTLGLPEDLLRNVAIALLFLVAATLLFPKVEEIVQRPFLRLTRRPSGDLGGGLLLGASLGLVFVPCAGPVLAAITVVGATQDVGFRAIVLTVAYAIGAAIPMLFVALGGRAGMTALRPHAHRIRQVLGVVVGLTALAIAFNVDRHGPARSSAARRKIAARSCQGIRDQSWCAAFAAAIACSTCSGPPFATSASTCDLRCGSTASNVSLPWTSFPPMIIGIEIRSFSICRSRACSSARSGVPGA